MDYNIITNGLNGYDSVRVKVYINYLKELQTAKDRQTQQPKNKWFAYFKPEQAVDLFKKVAIDNLYIDGETITLTNKGKVMVTYDYQAYKNRLLNIYPETLFDIQLVHRGDSFSFQKESGRVIYKHVLGDPFALNKEIIGSYCIIKNNRGEFIETLNIDEIQKMKNVAKTQKIWNEWYGEMILKSNIKRSCKRHFKDLVVNIEQIDNENYEPENVVIESPLQDAIEKCQTLDDLEVVYNENKDTVADKVVFMNLLSQRKMEIKQQQKTPQD